MTTDSKFTVYETDIKFVKANWEKLGFERKSYEITMMHPDGAKSKDVVSNGLVCGQFALDLDYRVLTHLPSGLAFMGSFHLNIKQMYNALWLAGQQTELGTNDEWQTEDTKTMLKIHNDALLALKMHILKEL